LCVCKLIKQYGIDPRSIYIQVSKYASSIGGTSAELEKNDILSIWDLMHGLMLPSGNDAAVSLAESFGTYIYLKSDKCKEKMKQDPDHANKQVKDPIKYFLYLMNKTAADLELKNTYYANPHGLVNTDSYSTACDQAKLTFQLLKWDMIREIVNKKEYRCEVEQEDQTIRNVCWENTNKLLGRKGWQGVKTGVTSAAGPSLSAYYEDEKDAYIIILLSSATMDIRWLEAMKLVNWSIKHKKDRPILM
jgi:D-alanyl-D-alanine carboxypeptidase (penicillin-binding protein 5/6)